MERDILMDAKNYKVSIPNSNLISTPVITIDSISIDIFSETEKIETGNCKHFSIRGYVAEMRKKDKKLCWPFPIDNKQNEPEDHVCTLPPLQTTKFRWWRCENCRREMVPQRAVDGVISRADKSEKGDEVACNTGIGHVNSSKKVANQKISRRKSVAEKFDLRLKPGSCSGDWLPIVSKCSGALVDAGESNRGFDEASADELSITKLNCQVKKQDIVSNGHVSAHHLLYPKKRDCAPSVNAETRGGNDLIDDLDEDTPVSHRQKPRKIRLLSDLLAASANARGDHNAANSHSLSDPQRRGCSKILTIGHESKDTSKKRKTGHDDGNVTLLETSPFDSENKKSRISLGGPESNYKELDRNYHHLEDSSTAMKKRDVGDDQNHILKKKKKKTQDVGNADVASSHQMCRDRVIELALQNISPMLESGTKSSLCKKKHKKPLAEHFQTVLMPWNYELLRKKSITRPEAQAPIFSYEDFLAAQQSKRNVVAPFNDRQPDSVLPKRKDVECKHGESSGLYRSTASAFRGKAVRQHLGIKTAAGPGVKSLVSENVVGPSSRAKERDLPTLQKMVSSASLSWQDDLCKRKGEAGIKLKAQGTDDNIPMEIVELLAKNKLERRLQSAGIQTSHKPKNGEKVVGVNNVRVGGEVKSSQAEQVQSATVRQNIIAIDGNVQWAKQKPASSTFPHMSLQEGSCISNRLGAFSSGVQQHSAGKNSGKEAGAHTSSWSSWLHNQFSHKDQARPLQNGKMTGNIPIPKPFDLNVACTEKQYPMLGSQSKINGGYRYGCNNGTGISPSMFKPKDVDSNDTIPAMHLLSLMDPGMRQISPRYNPQENNKFLKAPQFLQDRHLSSASSVDYRKNPISKISCDCAFTSSLRNDVEALKSRRRDKAKRPGSPKRSTLLMLRDNAKTKGVLLPASFECSHGKIPQRLASSDPSTLQRRANVVECSHGTIPQRLASSDPTLQRPANVECTHGTIPQRLATSDPNLQNSREIVCPLKKSTPNMEICVVNRNPADFTAPGPGNVFMIGPGDHKFSDECGITNMNGHKILRPREFSTVEKR